MRVVIKIGGSVIASPPSVGTIESYSKALINLRKEGHQVAVVVGGGSLARRFIKLAKVLGLPEEDQDSVAIQASRLVAFLLAAKLGDYGSGSIPSSPEEAARLMGEGKIPVMGGLRPGMTTDAVAALIAREAGADIIVKGTDQEGIYTKDPRRHPDAVRIEELTYDELSTLLTEKQHKAGIHQVLDPVALSILRKAGTRMVVLNGLRPEALDRAIRGDTAGTVVHP